MTGSPTIGIGPDGDFDADKLSPEMRSAIEGGMADALGRIRHLQEGQDRHRPGQRPPQFFGTAADLKGNYLYRMAGAVLGIYGNTAAEAIYPSVVQRLRRRTADRGEQLHLPVRQGSAAAGQRVLVADHVRAAAEPAGGEPDQPLADQLADAAEPGAGHRRRLHASTSRTSRRARTRKPTGCPHRRGRSRWCCGCTGRSPTRSTARGRRRSPKRSSPWPCWFFGLPRRSLARACAE